MYKLKFLQFVKLGYLLVLLFKFNFWQFFSKALFIKTWVKVVWNSMFYYCLNFVFVLFAILTRVSITGTSTSTPTTVTNVAPEFKPKSTIETATESSKKLLAPIIAAGAAILWGKCHLYAQPYAIAKIKNV